MANRAERLVWLSETIPELGGTGIVYCLTVDDTHHVAGWLANNGISAVAYSGRTEAGESKEIEQALLANDVKVVVATSALGMGFDKPDLSFVIHYQAPVSPIAYYQQVGRAGRSLDQSWAVLLRGVEDKEIQDYFFETAFPNPELAEGVVAYLAKTGDWCSIWELKDKVINGGASPTPGNMTMTGPRRSPHCATRNSRRWPITQEPPPVGWPFSVDPSTIQKHPTAVVATTALAAAWRKIWSIGRLLRQTTTCVTVTSRSKSERDGLTDQPFQ
jgi:hypothetical protein